MSTVCEYEKMMIVKEKVFVYACFLPPVKTNVIIKPGNGLILNDFQDYEESYLYQTFFIRPRIKSIPVNLKSVKKVEVKKVFKRDESVFAEY